MRTSRSHAAWYGIDDRNDDHGDRVTRQLFYSLPSCAGHQTSAVLLIPIPNLLRSLGMSVDVTRAALQMADKIVAMVNPQMPRTFGQ